ncbi:hypothetical protein [Pandoraea faecigallinarum]|uniref:hypothetical protein n=1 Tax=Pandoraea faecigallinarum TaxID=656179 RepID=UPI0012F49B22|nr:hypothetical protein [Pandoraea faecigallinarum]
MDKDNPAPTQLGEDMLDPANLERAEISASSFWSVTPAGFEMKDARFKVWVVRN